MAGNKSVNIQPLSIYENAKKRYISEQQTIAGGWAPITQDYIFNAPSGCTFMDNVDMYSYDIIFGPTSSLMVTINSKTISLNF